MVFVCPVHALDDCVEERVVDGQRVLWCVDRDEAVRTLEGDTGAPDRRRRANPAADRADAESWNTYARWNDAIAAVVFDGRHAGQAVYLDLEDDTLEEIAAEVGDHGDAAEGLASAVAATIRDTEVTNAQPFGGHRDRLDVWKQTYEGPPPFLALLGVFSMAADRMHSDGEFSSANYYGRLFEVLGRQDASDRAKDRLRAAYMKYAGDFWAAYDSWLRAEDGRLGVSTVGLYDGSLVHIGPAISQALIRPADKDGIVGFFLSCSFQPGTTADAAELQRLLRDYVEAGGEGFTKNLRRLITKDDATAKQVAELVAGELETWDGTVDEGAERASSSVSSRSAGTSPIRLAATFSQLFGKRLDLSAVVSLQTDDATLHIDGAHEPIDTDLTVAAPGLRELDLIDLDQSVWLNRSCRLESAHGTANRSPDNLVVLRWDEMLGAYLEQERISLGDDHLILVNKGMAAKALEILTAHGRPTPTMEDDVEGLPTGWRLITGVQLLEPPDPPGGLARLAPAVSRQLVLGGGTRLPGRVRRFHMSDLPEARVSAVNEGPFTVRIDPTPAAGAADEEGDGSPVFEAGPFEDAAIVALTPKSIGGSSGDYQVQAAATADGSVLTKATLRVRWSQDIRRDAEPVDEPLGWAPDGAEALLRPTRTAAGRVVGAAPTDAASGLDTGTGDPPGRERLWQRRHAHDAASSSALQPELGDAAGTPKCFERGAHYFIVPTFHGRARGKVVRNECKHCGLVLFTPSRPPRREGVEVVKAVIQTKQLKRVPPPAGLNMNYVLDALTYLSHGPWSWFSALVRQRADSALDVLRAARRLHALGHIEIERDERLKPVGFEVAPARVYSVTGSREAVLAGARSRTTLAGLKAAAKANGCLFRLDSDHRPARISITGDPDDLRAAAEAADLPFHENAARTYAAVFSAARLSPSALEPIRMPSRANLDLYDLESGSWVASGSNNAGAVRVRLPGRQFYAIRTPGDVTAGTLRPGPHDVVRHMAAAQAGVTLLAYDPEDLALSIPRYVGLPPPLERAAVLCSGRLPDVDEDNHAWVYRGVPTQVAAMINTAMQSAGDDE